MLVESVGGSKYRPHRVLNQGVFRMVTRVRGSWRGWSGRTIVELSDGTVWQQVEYKYEYRYAYRPNASVTNSLMLVEGMSQPVRVRRIASSSRHTVKGVWYGWKGRTVVELTNGSRWEQAEHHYEYHYAYRPSLFLIDNVMHVDGMSRPIRVRRIA